MDRIPNEVLSHILSYLLPGREKHRLPRDRIDHVLPVRLQSVKTLNDYFRSWRQLLKIDSIKAAVRRITIDPAPWGCVDGNGGDPLLRPAFSSSFDYWPAFTAAVTRICDIPNLGSLIVHFYNDGEDESGTTATQKRTLEVITRTLEARNSRPNTSIVRELALHGLKGTPLSAYLTDNLFRNIQRLHITVTYGGEERQRPEFSLYLSGTLLPQVSDHLVELTLGGFLWGFIPVEFNGKGLSFPRLKSLTLGDYIVLRQDQFDWVLKQRSLRDLKLYSCHIATHCLVDEFYFGARAVNLNGWKKVFDASTDMDQSDHGFVSNTPYLGSLQHGWYTNDLRWSNLFDRVRENLPELQSFTFDDIGWASYCYEELLQFSSKDGLSQRYLTFCKGGWSMMWYIPVTERGVWWYVDDTGPGCAVGLYTRTEPTDSQALERLIEETRKRREVK
ncbi:hypothetical protein FGADI_9539 [Fusarium gaditjirri]|uniref:F-box domain-containing protein n=1 Tax=Fusarium gaditjirri TaxID=282569 RepID=A0A8H4WSU3_9HYPO|nr:hypothetical protein FGADI_9539 [Fusarium gaditjirri]